MIPDSLEKMEFEAFYNCINLKIVDLSSNLTAIGYDVFGIANQLVK